VLISVFTPSHDTRFLNDAYESLARQSLPDWEWIVLLNKGAQWRPPREDPRVHVSRTGSRIRGIGALKRAACDLASGDILVELDHDDLLTRGCLAALADAFSNPGVVCAYSDWAQVNEDGSPNHDRFDVSNGWMYTAGTLEGKDFDRCHALAATPHNLGYIWYAPNHVRAFRRTAYDEVGGYNAELAFLDDQDLLCRLYLAGEFAHVERCLYLQRVHERMSQVEIKTNAAIQEQTVVYYHQHIEDLAQAWAKRHGLRCLRLRTPVWIGDEPTDGYEDVTIDPAGISIPADDDSVAVLRAYDVLNRVADRAGLFNEAYRVLAHAGLMLTQTPSTDGRGAFQDPSAVAYYNENTFMYLTQAALHDLIPDLKARLQVSHLRTFFPSPGHQELNICYVQANLLAVKDGPRQGGPLLC
jgi:glycosyltransferase involved in cell wall biosynthesis